MKIIQSYKPAGKSSGWKCWEDRPGVRERMEARRQLATRQDARRRGLWSACPFRQCRRKRTCAGDPSRCSPPPNQRRPSSRTSDVAAPVGPTLSPKQGDAPRFALSAREAAARMVDAAIEYNAERGDDDDFVLPRL